MSIEADSETPRTTSEQGSSNRAWRLVSAAGIAVALIVALVQSFPLEPRQARQFLFAGLVVGATLLALLTVFGRVWKNLRVSPDLLVPIGVAVLATSAIDLLAVLPMSRDILMPSWRASVLGLSLGLSVGTVLHMAVWTAFASWQTDLLWRDAQNGIASSLAPWPPIRRHFLRAYVALAIGVTVLLASVVPAIVLTAALPPIGLLAMGAIGVVWNLLTAALLPVVLFSSSSVTVAIREGLERSWALKGRWWKPLTVHLLLLGLIVVLRVHVTTTDQSIDRVTRVTTVNRHIQTNLKSHVSAFWTGGYECKCRWYSKYSEALKTKQVPIIARLLTILFLVVAVAMKWTVIRELVISSATYEPAGERET